MLKNFFHHYYIRKYHGLYRHAKKLFVFDLALLAIAVALFATSIFFFFWTPRIGGLIDLSISLGNRRIKSGDYVHLTVDYANRSKTTLTSAMLALRLPVGFIVDRQKTPENIFSKNYTFILPELPPGGNGQAELSGWLWAEPRQEEKIIATLSYLPTNSTRLEQKLAIFSINLPDSVLAGNLTMPANSFPNQPLNFVYALTNNGDEKLDQIQIINNWAQKPLEENKFKNIAIAPHETKNFEGKIVSPDKSGQFPLQFTAQILANNHLINQDTKENKIEVLAPVITVAGRLVNDLPDTAPGQTVPLEISWKNNTRVPLKNLRLKILASSEIVDLVKTAKDNRLKLADGALLIDSSVRTELANGNAGGADTFVVELKLRSSFAPLQKESAKLEITPIMEAEADQVAGQIFSQVGETLKIPLATELNWQAETRYYTADGDQLGRGPLPPRVGEATKYWIFVDVFNSTNAVEDAEFSAQLPAGVNFTGRQSVTIGPPLKYDNATRAVSWKFGELPANSVTGLYFEVVTTPSSADLEKTMLLAKDLTFKAGDATIKKSFLLTKNELTNILNSNDRGATLGAKVLAK